MKEEVKIGSKLDNLYSNLKAIRDPSQTGTSRQNVYNMMLKILDCSNTKRSSIQLDAFLIKAVHETFGESNIDADIMFMALGLMDGYNYNSYATRNIADRRAKYLRETDYLSNESIPYDDADKNIKSTYRERLRKSEEDPRFLLLAKSILSHKDNMEEYITETNNYIAKIGKNEITILPTPSYVVREAYQKQNRQKHLFKSVNLECKNNIFSTSENTEQFTTSKSSTIAKITITGLIEILSVILFIAYINTNTKLNRIYEDNRMYDICEEQEGGIWIDSKPQMLDYVKMGESPSNENEIDSSDSDEDSKSLF